MYVVAGRSGVCWHLFLTFDFCYCFYSWLVNGVDKTDSAIQKNFSSELRFKAMENAVVNCTADNGFGIDWKTGNISVLSKKCSYHHVFFFFQQINKP